MATSVSDPQQRKQHVQTTTEALRDQLGPLPSVGLIVADGDAPDALSLGDTCASASLPHGPDAGQWSMGTSEASQVVVFTDGPTLYDGHAAQAMAFPVQMMGAVGVDVLCLLGSAEPVAPTLSAGECVLVSDHINFQGTNPLVGPNIDDWGPRFPDMSMPYDPDLRARAKAAAREKGLPLSEGVYWGAVGPTAHTDAEDHMARTLGADAVGHTGVTEVIAARHMGLRVCSMVVMVGGDEQDGRADAGRLLVTVVDEIQQPAETV